jgi:WD40 repeat protein
MPRRALLLLLSLSLGAVPALAELPPEEIERTIRQLGDTSYERREAASRRLEELGLEAWPALRRTLARPGDAEMRTRCARLLDEGAQRLFGPLPGLSGHNQPINALAMSADGKRLLSGSDDATLRLWNPTNSEQLAQVQEKGGAAVWAVAVAPDGKRCLNSVGAVTERVKIKDYAIRLRDETLMEIRQLVGHTDEVRCLVFLPDGKRALSAGLDRSIRLWDLDQGKEIRRFVGHSGAVRHLAVSADGRRLLSSSQDRTVRCWEIETGKEMSRFSGHQGEVTGVVFLPDDKRAVSVGADKVARLWQIASGQQERRFEGHTHALSGVAVSPDGRWLLTSGGLARMGMAAADDHDIRLWNLATGEEIHRFTGHTSAVPVVLFAPDGQTIVSAGYDASLRRWKFALAPAR